MTSAIIQEVLIWKQKKELQRLIQKANIEDSKEIKIEKELHPQRMYINPEARGLRTYTNPFRSSREYSPV
jgi:hypothetical protein